MTLDFNTIFTALLGMVLAILVWNFQRLQAKADDTEKDLQAYKIFVATTYVTDNQLTKSIDAINQSIQSVLTTVARIEERLYKKEQQQ